VAYWQPCRGYEICHPYPYPIRRNAIRRNETHQSDELDVCLVCARRALVEPDLLCELGITYSVVGCRSRRSVQ